MSRQALVFLRDGRAYEGETQIAGSLIHFNGQRRVTSIDGPTYRPAGERTWPQRVISEIRWLSDQAVER